MKYSIALLYVASFLVTSIESYSLRRTTEGGIDIEVDLSDLTRKLQEGGDTAADTTAAGTEDGEEGLDPRLFGFEIEPAEGSDASLLNEMIAYFLPHINSLFQQTIPDPMGVPVHGSFHLPEMNLLGYCTATAGFDVSFGTLNGLSGVSIDRIKVIPGTEHVNAGYSVTEGCFQTIWSSVFDVVISSAKALSVDDLSAGLTARACSYSIDEELLGGMHAYEPRIHGAVNISGALLGNLATINIVDIVKQFEVGYSSIEGFVLGAPPALNQAIANITGELSMLAKDELMTFLMKDQLVNTVGPSVSARVQDGIMDQSIELTFTESVALGSGFVSNEAKKTMAGLVESAADALGTMGFDVGPSTAGEGDNSVVQEEDVGFVAEVESYLNGVITTAAEEATEFAEAAKDFVQNYGKEEDDQGIAGDDEPPTVQEEIVEGAFSWLQRFGFQIGN